MEGNAITWLCDKKTFPHSAEKPSRRREKNYKKMNVHKRDSENSGQPGGLGPRKSSARLNGRSRGGKGRVERG